MDEHVGAWTSGMARDEALALCERFQVPCGPVYGIDEIFDDPQYRARGNIAYVKDERVGELAVPNVVPRLSETPGRVKWLGPSQGAHADHVYRERLGLGEDEIARLRAAGAI